MKAIGESLKIESGEADLPKEAYTKYEAPKAEPETQVVAKKEEEKDGRTEVEKLTDYMNSLDANQALNREPELWASSEEGE